MHATPFDAAVYPATQMQLSTSPLLSGPVEKAGHAAHCSGPFVFSAASVGGAVLEYVSTGHIMHIPLLAFVFPDMH